MTTPYLHAHQLRRVSPEEAIAFVDACLGPPDGWPSPLVAYRLTSEFQRFWKEEVGHWLKTAERCGFLKRVLHDIGTQARPASRDADVHPNDKGHLKLQQHLAAARIVHYLTGTGWEFEAFEPVTGGAVDVDISLRAPGGTLVEIQVKASDQPGIVQDDCFPVPVEDSDQPEIVRGQRIRDGEYDDRILKAVEHAAAQLRSPATGCAMVFACPARDWPFTSNPSPLLGLLVGRTIGEGGRVYLRRPDAGLFFQDGWHHVAGVAVLDFAAGLDMSTSEETICYPCIVILNPLAAFPAAPEWFPGARVLKLDGNVFRWVRGAPGEAVTVPDRTLLVDEIPDPP